MTESVTSRNGIPIRLTAERWSHIVEEHAELAGLRERVLQTVREAESVYAGHAGELLASRDLTEGRTMVVVYRETSTTDGFIITAFITTRLRSLERRIRIWPPKI